MHKLVITFFVFVILFVGCGRNILVNISYTTGKGFTPESKYGEDGINISSVSFNNGNLTFTYTNKHARVPGNELKFDAEVSHIIIKTYSKNDELVDEITEQIFPGEIMRLPCNGKVISIQTNTKGKQINRIDIEHVCSFSHSRSNENLRRKLGL